MKDYHDICREKLPFSRKQENSIKPSDSQSKKFKIFVLFDSVYSSWLSLCVHGKCAQRHTLPLTKHVQLFVELRAVSEYDKWKYV